MEKLLKSLKNVLFKGENDDLEINQILNLNVKIKSIPFDLIYCNIVHEIYDSLEIEKCNEVIKLSKSQIKDISSLILKNNSLHLEIDVFFQNY